MNTINTTAVDNTFRYTNETFSGCDMVATITFNLKRYDSETKQYVTKPYTKVLGELTTVSYSIHMEKKPVRSIGNVNAKDYIMGPRTIAGSLVFSVFNRHFSTDIMKFIREEYDAGAAYLVDELPPFDITISAANEYGYRSRLAIYGVRLLNEGQVMSINDVYTENTYQFFATDVEYLNDEMKYERDESTGLYKLLDKEIETHKKVTPNIKYKYYITNENILAAQQKIDAMGIKIIELVKHPTRKDTPGIIDFSIEPPQDEGYMYITNSKNEELKIQLHANENNKSRTMQVALEPDIYTAYFQNSRNRNISNKVRFKVNNFIEEKLINKYKPIVERITDTSIDIYSNDPSHNKAKIIGTDSEEVPSFDISKRRCSINGLNPKTQYMIQTYNSNDEILSPAIVVTTLSSKDKIFEELTLFCYANSRHLAFVDMQIYNKLIAEAKEFAEQNEKSITESLLKIKSKYLTLYKQEENTANKEVLQISISACNELLNFALRINNDLIKAVNDSVEVPIPEMNLNDKYETVFTFDKSITSAEFYKQYRTINQLYYESPSYNFKNIDGVENSFRFNGKPGMKHYVEAKIGKARSPKLEFYVLTHAERDELIAKDEAKNKLTDKEIDSINSQIAKDKVPVEETDDYKRAFMINAKRKDDAILFPPDIETINENILVRTSINNILDNSITNEYYLALATYEDILCDNPIYKIKFTNLEEIIAITKMHHGLQDGKVYSVWIEDDKLNQLSNASTFVYSKGFNLDEDQMKEYEIKDIVDDILEIADNNLSKNVANEIRAILENNKTLSNIGIVAEVLKSLTSLHVKEDELTNFLIEFKKYIGIKNISDASLIYGANYSNGFCKFNCDIEGSLLLYNVDAGECYFDKTTINTNNTLNTNAYNGYILLMAINKNLKNKSKLIFIDIKKQSMEVL